MSASLRLLTSLAMVAAVAMTGCKPPPAPAAGGLVSGSQPDAPASTTPVSAQPNASVTIEPGVNSFPAGTNTAPPAQAPPATGGTPLAANPDLLPVGVANSRGPQDDAAPAQAGSVASARSPSIRLSAGVAVPTSLPGGTQMGISVDYAITGPLNGAAKYLWVIKSEAGQIESEVQLQTRGTLQAIVPLRPDDRPFNVQIVEVLTSGERKRVSNEAVMQTSY